LAIYRFLGNPDCARRGESWALLKLLKSFLPLPWFSAGDFNEIVEQSEKEGAAIRRESQMVRFRKALEACDLDDLGFIGPKFTWYNHRMDGSFTKERLDRAVADSAWCSRFQSVTVHVLASCTSDHHPLHVSFQTEQYSFKRGFKFEAGWVKDEEYQALVRAAWEVNSAILSPIEDVQSRLTSCQKTLSLWSQSKFGRAANILQKKKEELLSLQSRANPALAGAIKTLQADIEKILEREDMRWKQRSKQNWYLLGDRNTQYFHSWVN
jgi:hypothetical protein